MSPDSLSLMSPVAHWTLGSGRSEYCNKYASLPCEIGTTKRESNQ